MAVHYCAYPCDMDAIMPIARKYNLNVIEDVSHAQGGHYRGKKLGTFGDVAAMSLMSGKSFVAGELGILVTDDREIYERAMAFGHYERNNAQYITETAELKPYYHIALGGVKGRANQVCTALARIQLKYYDERCAEIRKAMNYFWDLLDGLPGIRPIRVDEASGSDMAGWYCPQGAYHPEELGGLSVGKFCEAVRAEGFEGAWDGANYCLHTHNFFKTFDHNHSGVPSRIENDAVDVRPMDEACKPSETKLCFSIPWFKHFDREWIEKYANAYKKVVLNYAELLETGTQTCDQNGHWYGMSNEAIQNTEKRNS